jgi:hypothetical protein
MGEKRRDFTEMTLKMHTDNVSYSWNERANAVRPYPFISFAASQNNILIGIAKSPEYK